MNFARATKLDADSALRAERGEGHDDALGVS